MCRKNEVDCSFIKLLRYFYHGIQCNKTRNFVPGEAFEVQDETYQFYVWSLKDTQNLLRMFDLHEISKVCH